MLRSTPSRPRRAAILLVVLIMLALFAVIGLSFVLYAESEANAARIAKESVNRPSSLDSSDAVNGFLGQLLYQQGDTKSALYGHELSRLIYGDSDPALMLNNSIPYNGVGIYSENLLMPVIGVPSLHRTQVVRFGSYAPDPTSTSTVYIYPDQTYAQNGYVDQSGTGALPIPAGATRKYVGRNAPYTYPDRNNISVAVLDPGTGLVVKPSFHAPTLFGPLAANNPNWYAPQGYFQLLRPRTIDNLTAVEIKYLKDSGLWPPTAAMAGQLYPILSGQSTDPNAPTSFARAFPFPAANADGTTTGDVFNYKFGEGQQANDAVWIDPNLPIVTHNGRRLKPLIAATVLPLDGRVNLNVAGNLVNGGTAQGSNMGFGPAEVSLNRVFAATTMPTTPTQQMLQMRYGSPTATAPPSPYGSTRTTMLYDPDRFRNATDAPVNTTYAAYPPSYGGVDFNGDGQTQPALPTGAGGNPPTGGSAGAFSPSLYYPTSTYGNSNPNNPGNEQTQPPLLFNPFQWNPLLTTGSVTAGSQFPLSDARYLTARYSDKTNYLSGFTYLGQQGFGFEQTTPEHPMNRVRALTTTVSNRLARPNLAPMDFGSVGTGGNNAGTLSLSLTPPTAASLANGLPAPVLTDPVTVAAKAGPAFDLSQTGPFTTPTSRLGGDIVSATNTVAANVRAVLQGVDLNRPLPDYRDPTTLPPTPPMGSAPSWQVAPNTISITSAQKATAARQALAKDIFQRLAVALNARVYFDTTNGLILPQPGAGAGMYTLTGGGQTWQVSQAEYDALRWVAQLAANAVDAIDGDDISTVFVWNPVAAGVTDPTNFTAHGTPGGSDDRVVFGVERPKLVINETYAEVANKQADYMSNPSATDPKGFEARFWVELLNPSNAEYTNSSAPTADQSARNGGTTPLQFTYTQLADGTTISTYSVYRVRVYNNSTEVHRQLTQGNLPTGGGNPLGAVTLPPMAPPQINLKLDVGFDSTTWTSTAGNFNAVEPNNGAFSAVPGGGNSGRNGFCVIGPKLDPATTEAAPTAYAPKTGDNTSPDGFMLLKTLATAAGQTDALNYDVSNQVSGKPVEPDQIPNEIINSPTNLLNTHGHAVVLVRLANPYMPPNDPTITNPPYNSALPYNPYVTVDFMADIKVNDAIRIGPKPQNGNPMANGMRNTTPARPDANFALGRCQPFAGYQQVTTTPGGTTPFFTTQVPNQPPALPAAPYTFPPPPLAQTLAVPQNPDTTNPAGPAFPPPTNTTPRQTFFRQNSRQAPTAGTTTFPNPATETIVTPFHAPHHPDRLFTSPLELMHVAVVPPHLLTHAFARPNTTAPTQPTFAQQELLAQMLPPAGGVTPPYYRALEAVNMKPWTFGLPHAGRVPGGINVNMIWDEINHTAGTPTSGDSTVFQALLDRQPANTFTDADVTRIWQNLRQSRSPAWDGVPQVGVTVDEIDPNTNAPGTDRPFKGFGVGQFDSTGTTGVLNTAGGLPNTGTTPPTPNGNGHGLQATVLRTVLDSTTMVATPLFAATSSPLAVDPYYRYEPLRKASNNLTTTSDTFLVVFTVGYFDIEEEPGRVILRREAYDTVPGDLREQFTAVLDRSGLAVDPTAPPNSGATGKFGQTVAATALTKLSPATGAQPATYYVRFPAIGADASSVAVRDNPTANGSSFKLFPGSRIRIGDGPNAEFVTVQSIGASNPTPSPGYPAVNIPAALDQPTALATVTVTGPVNVDASGNPIHAAGELIALPDNEASNGSTVYVPGNPGAVAGFDPTDSRFRGVVRYFGRLTP
jgi:hypothetical protein